MFSEYKLEEISNFYSKDPSDRYNNFIHKFNETYSSKPDFIARAPGRVNIIG
jgi:galactokinase